MTTFSSAWAESIFKTKYSMNGQETWPETARRVAFSVMGSHPQTRDVANLMEERKFIPGGRYLAMAGRPLKMINNCFLMRAGDSREDWAQLLQRVVMVLSLGGGVGIDYSEVRCSGSPISRTGGVASGPISLMQMVNEVGRHVMAGGSRRSAIWAGLSWKHSDIFDFIHGKDWIPEVRALKEQDFSFPATLDMTNVSVILDDEFFMAYRYASHSLHNHAYRVYWESVRRMTKTGEPGFSIDVGLNARESLRNPCCEITSYNDSDVCNIGSLNLARIESLADMERAMELATLFLLMGTIYSDVPYEKAKVVRAKNRRIGLGVMGVHEWLLVRDKKYGSDQELAEWLNVYARSGGWANNWADDLGVSRPVKTRAIAPTGSISIIGETTAGIEPVFCTAYKRRYLAGSKDWRVQLVVDPTAKRLIDQGIDPDKIEDAYFLAMDVERRIAFQAWVQQFVDHGISSTVNLPGPLEDSKQFGTMLLDYLPQLRGITVYPNGARGGQPLTPVDVRTALAHEGVVFENEETCPGGVCGA